MIDKSKTYRTRDGREVRIYATDGKGPSSVVHGAVNAGDGWVPHSWFASGMYRHGYDGTDLIEVKPRIKREVWVNVYDDEQRACRMYSNKTSADANCDHNRIACVKLTIDCEEGEGL